QVLDELAGRRIQPQDAVVVLAARPDVAGLVDGDVVRPGAGRRRRPFLERRRAGVEHPDLVGAVLAEPEAILRVHHAAARARARRRRLEDLDLPALRVDLPDLL